MGLSSLSGVSGLSGVVKQPVLGGSLTYNTSGILAAWGFKNVYPGYTGNTVRLIDDGNNEQDFTEAQILNQDYLSMPSPTNIWVKTFYDQSGNGRNATQNQKETEPTFRENGVIFGSVSNPAFSNNNFGRRLEFSATTFRSAYFSLSGSITGIVLPILGNPLDNGNRSYIFVRSNGDYSVSLDGNNNDTGKAAIDILGSTGSYTSGTNVSASGYANYPSGRSVLACVLNATSFSTVSLLGSQPVLNNTFTMRPVEMSACLLFSNDKEALGHDAQIRNDLATLHL